MSGYIRKTEVLREALTVIRGWGFRVFLRCLLARRGETFLSIAMRERVATATGSNSNE